MLRRISFIAVLAFVVLLLPGRADAGDGPIDTTGEINGAPYRIAIPANWNGTLLVYGHGYRDKADQPGEIDNRNPDIAPNSALADVLLAQGFALAGSAYRDNGWEVEGGIQDLKDLTVYFRDTYGKPEKTILWAFSMGTIIAFESMERFNGIYDGALCGCAVGAGASATWDTSGDLALAYDVVFGIPPAWGNFADVNDTIDFETAVFPKLFGEVTSPVNFPKFEFIRLVSGTPGRGVTAPAGFYPNWLFTDMYFVMEARAELERRTGGPVIQNLDREYSLTVAERAYLAGFGLTAPVVDAWLAAMNGQRIAEAPKFSRNYVEHNADYSGKIKGPVLTMHTIVDPLVAVSHAHRYRETVEAAGREARLKQAYTTGNGHCSFTGPQLLTAIAAINAWVETGEKPTDAAFPAALGFSQAFVPPPMNQP
jgi:pimeloyl-ACP methyl ester carboxylesterase